MSDILEQNLYHIVRRQFDEHDHSFNELKALAQSMLVTINKTSDKLQRTKEKYKQLTFEQVEPNKKLLQEIDQLIALYRVEKEDYIRDIATLNKQLLELQAEQSTYQVMKTKCLQAEARVKELEEIITTERGLRRKAERNYFTIKEQIHKYSKTYLLSKNKKDEDNNNSVPSS